MTEILGQAENTNESERRTRESEDVSQTLLTNLKRNFGIRQKTARGQLVNSEELRSTPDSELRNHNCSLYTEIHQSPVQRE